MGGVLLYVKGVSIAIYTLDPLFCCKNGLTLVLFKTYVNQYSQEILGTQCITWIHGFLTPALPPLTRSQFALKLRTIEAQVQIYWFLYQKKHVIGN